MRTRLTELLGIEHPVMLAGMGGVSYSELVAAVSEAGGSAASGPSTMSNATMVAEMRRRARGHGQALRCRSPHRHARQA
jgi:enoyl-[acyl-carrier protein] reductase II